jgi:Zn-dependent protease
METESPNGPARVGAAPGLDDRRASLDPHGVVACPECGTEVAASLLACPACGWLRHSLDLKQLAELAEKHERNGAFTEALVAWRSALDLLPPHSRQHAVVAERIAELGRQGTSKPPEPKPPWARRAGILGAIALFLWKFKVVIAFLLTKGKLLLLGFTKAGTLFSMLLSIGVYWRIYGWKWAVGVVASIYIHEMGHVAMLRRFGIAATAPMFIPGVGAFIRARFYPNDVVAEARVGLAGPMWGMGAAIVCWLVYVVTDLPAWGALAEVGAYINLFNLIPVWQLDGAHGFQALTRPHRWVVAAAFALAWALAGEGLLLIILIFAVIAAFGSTAPAQADRRTLLEFLLLIAVLTALASIPVPIAALN